MYVLRWGPGTKKAGGESCFWVSCRDVTKLDIHREGWRSLLGLEVWLPCMTGSMLKSFHGPVISFQISGQFYTVRPDVGHRLSYRLC